MKKWGGIHKEPNHGETGARVPVTHTAIKPTSDTRKGW